MIDVPVVILMSKPLFARYNTPIKKVMELMVKKNKNYCILLDENNNPVGIVTSTDIIKYLVINKGNYKTPTYEIATKKLISVSPNTKLEEALEIMRKHKISKLPIVNNGKVVGVISADELLDVLPYIIDALKSLADYLTEVINQEISKKEENNKNDKHDDKNSKDNIKEEDIKNNKIMCINKE